MSYPSRKYPRLDRPRTRWELVVERPQAGIRLGEFLVSRVRFVEDTAQAADLVAAGRVTVTPFRSSIAMTEAPPGGPGDGAGPAVPGVEDVLEHRTGVTVEMPPPAGLADPRAIPIEALYDDGVLFAMMKQPRLAVQPRSGNDMSNVLAALHARYRTDDPETDRVPHLGHRIDVDTSGVLLCLWDPKLTARVKRQFETREIKKQYLAIVHGAPPEERGTVDVPLVSDHKAPAGTLMNHPGAHGKAARTDWEVVERFRHFALVRFFPYQGRTHQIRLHSLYMGHPLLCDNMYGGGVAFTESELRALERADSAVRLPLAVGESGDTKGQLKDLVESVELTVLSPILAAAREDRLPLASVTDVLKAVREAGEGCGEDDAAAMAARCMLHSAVLELRHPSTGVPTRIEADIPADMQAVLTVLRECQKPT